MSADSSLGSQDKDVRAIRTVVAAWHRATVVGDVGTVLGLMSEDVVFLVPGRLPMKGREEFELGLRQLLKSHRIESAGDVHDIAVSGELGYCLTYLTVKISPLDGSQSESRSGYAMSVFRKQADGAWWLIRDANLLPPPG